MKQLVLALSVATSVLVGLGCTGDQVALNERLFAASTLAVEGSGCTLYMLGSGDQESTATSAIGLTVTQTLADATVLVEVRDGDTSVATRRYDGAFFQDGVVDMFTVPSSAGDSLLLRYWGRFHPGGTAGCAPLTDDGSR
jgi:hypothetical protein